MSQSLEETFPNCPECGAPWKLHWLYIRDDKDAEALSRGAQLLRRRYNTCGMTREQIVSKWIERKAPIPGKAKEIK